MDAKGITVRIGTAEWVDAAIESIGSMGEDLIKLGVPQEIVRQTCKDVIIRLVTNSVKVEVPIDRMRGGVQDFLPPKR